MSIENYTNEIFRYMDKRSLRPPVDYCEMLENMILIMGSKKLKYVIDEYMKDVKICKGISHWLQNK